MNTIWFMEMASAVALIVLAVILAKRYWGKHTPTTE